MTTKVFGDYSINNKKIIALRHTINPSVSFIYTPQTSQNYFDYRRVSLFLVYSIH